MEFFEFSSDALYPSFNNELILQSLETTDSLLPSEQHTERGEFSPSHSVERNLNNNVSLLFHTFSHFRLKKKNQIKFVNTTFIKYSLISE